MDAEEAKTAMQRTVETFRQTTAEIRENAQWAVEVDNAPLFQQYLRDKELSGLRPEPMGYGDDPVVYDKLWDDYNAKEKEFLNTPLSRTVAELDPENLSPEFVAWIQTHGAINPEPVIEIYPPLTPEETLINGDPVEIEREVMSPGWGRNIGYDGLGEWREHRSEGRLSGAQDRIAKRLAAKQQPQQEHGYGRSY